jgi:hypothetical protein
MLTPARGLLLKPERRANRYSPPTMARAPTTESTATTQKSIASMHSPYRLLSGITESLPTLDARVTTLWQLSRRIRLLRCALSVGPQPLYSPLPRWVAPSCSAASALPRAYGAAVFPLPCLAGEPVRGRR